MADTINIRSLDIAGTEGTSSSYLPSDSPAALVDALTDLVQIAQVAAVEDAKQTIQRFQQPFPQPDGGETPLVSEAAALVFHCDDNTDWTFYLLAPKDGTFNPDGSVDGNQTWMSDLIQWLLDNACNPEGSLLQTYLSGEFVELIPGFLDMNGAASYARQSGLVAEFWAQDGADLKVSGE